MELIPLKPIDVKDEWAEWFESPHLKTYTRSGRQIELDELRRSIEMGLEDGSTVTLGVRMSKGDSFFGTIKIGPIDKHHGLSDLAVMIGDKDYLGRGLGSKLVEAGSEYAFNELGIRKLHGGILEKNIASLRTYVKAGWIVEGLLPKHYSNDGILQDWYLISKYHPDLSGDDIPCAHAIKLPI